MDNLYLEKRKASLQSISVVVPCYNEEEVITETYKRLKAVLNKVGIPYEIIFVDDGSKDNTWGLLSELSDNDKCVKAIKLARNHGHQFALTCGLDQSKGEVVLIIDADLQDPPELLEEMLEKWKEGYYVIYGKRIARDGESRSKRFFAFSFYRIISKISKIEIPRDTGDFRLVDRKALDVLLKMREPQRFIRGMVAWIGFPQTPILYHRQERFAGSTKYPFKKSLLLAFDAITSFSYVPLRLTTYLGMFFSFFSFIYFIVVIVLKFKGVNFSGYTSLMGAILMLGGIQLIMLGIIGEYVGRIFQQGQKRPLYIIQDIKGEPFEK
ncbi:MAG: glycosyltransferase family 2 protein [Bdellovibrionota bacterium]